MKKPYRIYLEEKDFKRLLAKAENEGFTGKGKLSRYLTILARRYYIFLNDSVLKYINQKMKTT